MALLIAVISAWAAIYFNLVPLPQTRAAYEAYVAPFGIALLVYLMFQVLRAPFVLDREQRDRIESLELAASSDSKLADLEDRKLRVQEREIAAMERQTEEMARATNEASMRDATARSRELIQQWKEASTLKVKIERVNPSFEFEGSPLSGGSAICFDVTISNSGSPTVIRDWELKVNDKTYKPAAVRIDVNGSSLVKPLELGGHRSGRVWFVISDINLEQASALLREAWELTFCDVTGRRFKAVRQ